MVDLAGQHVGDGLDAAVRVPGKAGEVVGGVVGAEVVEQQERVEVVELEAADAALEPHAGTLHHRLRGDAVVHVSWLGGHGDPPCRREEGLPVRRA